MVAEMIPIGATVRITQLVELGPASLRLTLTGKLYARERFETSSSFAREEGGHLWVERIYIEKPDGERSGLLIDQNTKVELVP